MESTGSRVGGCGVVLEAVAATGADRSGGATDVPAAVVVESWVEEGTKSKPERLHNALGPDCQL